MVTSGMSRIGITWQIGSYSGWGVYGLQIALHALRSPTLEPVPLCDLSNIDWRMLSEDALSRLKQGRDAAVAMLAGPQPAQLDFPVLHGLGNRMVSSAVGARVCGTPDVGLVFLEDTTLDAAAVERSRRYVRIVAGSTWNGQVLRAAGLNSVVVQPQGVDLSAFHPAPSSGEFANRFIVFSGGKLEYRKGQDIVIESFRRFHERHPEALLLAAWYNPWPQLVAGIARSDRVQGSPAIDDRGRVHLSSWLRNQGLPESAFRLLNPLPNRAMAGVLREADVALFPNRCEGGTNMVAMECLACGIPTILSANTGHFDLIAEVPCYSLQRQGPVIPESPDQGVEGWGESDTEEILDHLECIYTDRAGARDIGRRAGEAIHRQWGWERQLDRLFTALDLPATAVPNDEA